MTDTRPLDLADLYHVATPADPALAPDGSRVVYVLHTVDRDADRNIRALWQVRPGETPRRLTRGTADFAPRWAPDGRSLAFLRAEAGPAQLWLLPADGGEPERLTELPLGAGVPVWHPDGTHLAFCAPVGPATADSAPRHTARRMYKLDGTGPLGDYRSQLFVLDLADRSVRQVTSGDFHAGIPAWSPDGTRLAFADALAEDGAPAKSAARIVDATATRSEPDRIGPADGTVAAVTWSANGSALLAVTTPDTEVRDNRLLSIALDGAAPVELTAGLDRNVMPGAPGYPGALPQPIGDTVLFCARDRGHTHLYAHGDNGIRVLIDGDRVVSGLSVAPEAHCAAMVVTARDSFGEIVLLDLSTGAERTLTAHTAGALPDIAPIPVRERIFTVSDGTEVHGWLIGDPNASAPGPLLVDAHGGPHNAWSSVWDPAHAYHQILAARGWTVLLLNPRGSDGYGEDFRRAALGGWGVADERDFLEPIEQLITEQLADPARIALCGYSYGGYVACWLPTRTDRFAAAIAGGAVSDLVSLAGTSDCGAELIRAELGVTYWDEPATVAKMSPITAVDQVGTPTLLLHGAADERCPLGQAEQWYTALHERGVPTELVSYPNASHLFILDGVPSHRVDYNRRIVDWAIRHTRAGGSVGAATTIAPLDAGYWQRRLDILAAENGLPGAVLAISHGDQIVDAACGVLNLATGSRVTADSLFQIGSISKVWTATAAMRLVEQGKLELDQPIVELLPALRLSDPDTNARITMRHLLTHTSGIDGDVFTDTGRGDDCLERYVAELADIPCIFPLGSTFSYCNSGFSLAGRVIEVLTGSTWDAAMRELLFTPLGLEHTVTLPEQALLFRAAVGHVRGPDGDTRRADQWVLPRSAGPAGLIAATARDLLTFARMHIDGGLAADGTRLLSTESVEQMQSEQVALPGSLIPGADTWGLGWWRGSWDGHRSIGHNGGTIGQNAFLDVLPGHRLAVALLTNGDQGAAVFTALRAEIAATLAGVTAPEPLRPPANPPQVDSGRNLGSYERTGSRMTVFDTDEGLRLRITVTGDLAEVMPEAMREQEHRLIPIAEDRYLTHSPQGWMAVAFFSLNDRRYLHMGGRAAARQRTDAG